MPVSSASVLVGSATPGPMMDLRRPISSVFISTVGAGIVSAAWASRASASAISLLIRAMLASCSASRVACRSGACCAGVAGTYGRPGPFVLK